MIRDAVEQVKAVADANFQTDFNALCTAASLANVTVDIYKRRGALRFHSHTGAGLGLYHKRGATSRRRPGAATGAGIRDTRVTIVLEWYLAGTDEDVVQQQTELAIQAMLRAIVDEIPASLIWGAADARDSVTWEVEVTPLGEQRDTAECLVEMQFPAVARSLHQAVGSAIWLAAFVLAGLTRMQPAAAEIPAE